jgi:hypothetical protein
MARHAAARLEENTTAIKRKRPLGRREPFVTPSRATDIRTHQSINPKLQRNGGTKA